MERLAVKYQDRTKTIRASRVDYFTQHSASEWVDQLGAFGCGGPDSVFVNLAAVAGPVPNKIDGMHDVNYRGAVAAAQACAKLNFGHFIQSSTQATVTERAGQVPYSRGKAMADFALSRIKTMPVTIACLGLLYCKVARGAGQDHGAGKLNLTDLSLLPLTPVLGSGAAPLQPLEVSDAARRLLHLAVTDPASRPRQRSASRKVGAMLEQNADLRMYDAVGPETMTMIELLARFAALQGKEKSFRPVHISYRTMEKILNLQSLGNLNRQFVSLLRSEQDGLASPVLGDPTVFSSLIEDEPLLTLEEAMLPEKGNKRVFPYLKTLRWVIKQPKIIPLGLSLGFEIVESWAMGRKGEDKRWSA